MMQFPDALYCHGIPDCHGFQAGTKDSCSLPQSVSLDAAVLLQCHIASAAEPATAAASSALDFGARFKILCHLAK